MQWDKGVNAGFSAASTEKLYIPQDPDPDRPTVEAQLTDPDSQLQQVKTLISLRRIHPALGNRSGITFVSTGAPKQALAYERSCEQEQLLVVLNPYREAVTFPYAKALGEPLYTFGGEASQEGSTVSLNAVSAGIYRIK